MTFLEMVNNILARLGEDQVASVDSTKYSKIVGIIINDTMREIENTWHWRVLHQTLGITTVASTESYLVAGSGIRQRFTEIYDSTMNSALQSKPLSWITSQALVTPVVPGRPLFYAWSGNNGTASYIKLSPVPDGEYLIFVNAYINSSDMVNNDDAPKVDPHLILLGAHARAALERGEDTGMSSSELYQLFRSSLSDAIAMEADGLQMVPV